mmetsp:Transcript_76960/g.129230  ORF Transcript_76960/g.129230 Transcript_76960/m.129230 type:complete len:205 (+) Transcript_76960:1297-1911(+)
MLDVEPLRVAPAHDGVVGRGVGVVAGDIGRGRAGHVVALTMSAAAAAIAGAVGRLMRARGAAGEDLRQECLCLHPRAQVRVGRVLTDAGRGRPPFGEALVHVGAQPGHLIARSHALQLVQQCRDVSVGIGLASGLQQQLGPGCSALCRDAVAGGDPTVVADDPEEGGWHAARAPVPGERQIDRTNPSEAVSDGSHLGGVHKAVR